jgi:glycosyltransferase involved in cell wall biosynthesis
MIYTARAIFIDKKNTKWLFGNNIIAVSNAVKSNLMDYFGISSDKIKVIYNGSDLRHASKSEINNVLEKYMLNKENRIISAIGRLSEIKGYSFLIQALLAVKNDYPSIKLLIVGDGELKSELKELVAKSKLNDNVIFCGNQKNVQVFYDISEFTVMSSLWEGMPGAAIESIMLEKPVIATKVGGLPEIIENNMNGLLVPPKDSNALAEAIKYLLSNPQLVKEMGIIGKKIVQEKFTLEKMLQDYLDYYTSVAYF